MPKKRSMIQTTLCLGILVAEAQAPDRVEASEAVDSQVVEASEAVAEAQAGKIRDNVKHNNKRDANRRI